MIWECAPPEGPFPSWGSASTFHTYGEGENNGQGGVVFRIGENVEAQYSKYDEGQIIINRETNQLILNAKLSNDYKNSTNHSGVYHCAIHKPLVYQIETFSSQEAMDDKYVKAIGHFDGYNFYSGPYAFNDCRVGFIPGDMARLRCQRNREQTYQTYKVVGRVQKNLKNKYDICLFSIIPADSK